ncbi:MAG: hypothetical protein ACP5QT_02910 [Brevinematia bacterium]
MALLIDLYEALKKTAGEEKVRKAIENLEAHKHWIFNDCYSYEPLQIFWIKNFNLLDELNRATFYKAFQ